MLWAINVYELRNTIFVKSAVLFQIKNVLHFKILCILVSMVVQGKLSITRSLGP